MVFASNFPLRFLSDFVLVQKLNWESDITTEGNSVFLAGDSTDEYRQPIILNSVLSLEDFFSGY